jgi:hypothetical protein
MPIGGAKRPPTRARAPSLHADDALNEGLGLLGGWWGSAGRRVRPGRRADRDDVAPGSAATLFARPRLLRLLLLLLCCLPGEVRADRLDVVRGEREGEQHLDLYQAEDLEELLADVDEGAPYEDKSSIKRPRTQTVRGRSEP